MPLWLIGFNGEQVAQNSALLRRELRAVTGVQHLAALVGGHVPQVAECLPHYPLPPWRHLAERLRRSPDLLLSLG